VLIATYIDADSAYSSLGRTWPDVRVSFCPDSLKTNLDSGMSIIAVDFISQPKRRLCTT
jgi:hypothetical protein